MGFEHGFVSAVGVIELALMGLYLVPRTALLGAVLWSGYLALTAHGLTAFVVAFVLWLALYARRRAERQLFGCMTPRPD